jgi:hypothetical protein
MNLTDLLQSDPVLTLAGTIAGGVWSILKAKALRRRNKKQRFDRAILALEAGIEDVYRSYVREIKRARQDGKLTAAEAARARRLARERAIDYGRHEGVDVLKEIGADYLDLWIAKLIRRTRS